MTETRALKHEIGELNEKNIRQLAKLNDACFPISYQEDVYRDMYLHNADFSRFVFVADVTVGAIACRLQHLETGEPLFSSFGPGSAAGQGHSAGAESPTEDPSSDAAAPAVSTLAASKEPRAWTLCEGKKSLYVMMLNVLPRYRRRGLGKALLSWLFQELESKKAKEHGVEEVLLHVHSPNEAALAFYAAHGFEVVAEIPDYYGKLEVTSAIKLRKKL